MKATNKGYWGVPPLSNPSLDAPPAFALSASMDFREEMLRQGSGSNCRR